MTLFKDLACLASPGGIGQHGLRLKSVYDGSLA